jgi:hypothetical protein
VSPCPELWRSSSASCLVNVPGSMPKKEKKEKMTDEAYDRMMNTRSFAKVNKVENKPWTCKHEECAYENEDPDTEECEACGEERYPELPDAKAGAAT